MNADFIQINTWRYRGSSIILAVPNHSVAFIGDITALEEAA